MGAVFLIQIVIYKQINSYRRLGQVFAAQQIMLRPYITVYQHPKRWAALRLAPTYGCILISKWSRCLIINML